MAGKGNDVSTTATTNGEVVSSGLVDKFHAYMLDRARTADNRSGEIMRDQTERILTAQTEDEIWDADTGGTIQCRDVPGLMVEIRSYEPVISNRTDIENSSGYYLSMDATVLGALNDDVLTRNGLHVGQDIALQTGAWLLMSKVRAMEAGGYLPMRTLIKDYTTQSGNTVLKFARMPVMAQPGTAS
jgi:hypothetical protein